MRGLSCFIEVLLLKCVLTWLTPNLWITQRPKKNWTVLWNYHTKGWHESFYRYVLSNLTFDWRQTSLREYWRKVPAGDATSACQEFQTASGLVWRRKQRLAGIFHHLRLMSASRLLPLENGACNAAVVWGAPGAGKSCHSEDCVVCRQRHVPASITERPSLQSKACFLNDKALRVWNIYLVVANHLSWGKGAGRKGLYTILMVKKLL